MDRNNGSDLYQIAILIDRLKHEEVQFRVNASNNLPRIAQALGPERTRDELIPILCGTFGAPSWAMLLIYILSFS